MRIILPIILLAVLMSCNQKPSDVVTVLPAPKLVSMIDQSSISLANGLNIQSEQSELDPLKVQFPDDLVRIHQIISDGTSKQVALKLAIDNQLELEEYNIVIKGDIQIKGGSYQAVSMALVSVLQLIDGNQLIGKGQIHDQPAFPYRSFMLDCARSFHNIDRLKEVILMCSWYKINYLHLHLTDDQLFTFQSRAFPELATKNYSYSQEELKDLNQYAHERGVTLIPEIDIPGHATPFVQRRPDIFGIGDVSRNGYTMSMGKEKCYEALNTLIQELADVFMHSPYIHIGGDEAFFEGMDEDPETIAYMEKWKIPSVNELFRHFLNRVNDMVIKTGKQTMVWAGFSPDGDIEVSKDIIVVLWEPQYYNPQRLVDDGYSVINASFKPLYIVNNRKWGTEYIYNQWNERRWESWAVDPDTFLGQEVQPNDQILGATMCSWEQRPLVEIRRARKRLAAMSERLWNPEKTDFLDFENRLEETDAMLSRLLHPFSVKTANTIYPIEMESNFYEHTWFRDSIKIEMSPFIEDITLKYGFSNDDLSTNGFRYDKPFCIDTTRRLYVQAFDAQNKAVGLPFENRYQLNPVLAQAINVERDFAPNSWEKSRFKDSLILKFFTPLKGHKLKYRIYSEKEGTEALDYAEPVQINYTARVEAYVVDEKGKRLGQSFSNTYYKIVETPCLTTGKPIIASNEHLTPGRVKLANDGRITLWEQWGDHLDGDNWIKIDLEKETLISQLDVTTFFDNYRYYQYTIEGSNDDVRWEQIVDFSENEIMATMEPYVHKINPRLFRYLKLNMLYNSANPGLHVVEFCAY